MSLGKASTLVMTLFSVASCLFMNSSNEEDAGLGIGPAAVSDSPRSTLQTAIDSVDASLDSWSKVLDSLQWYRSDSIGQEMAISSTEAAGAALHDRMLFLMPSLATKGPDGLRLEVLQRRVLELAAKDDSLMSAERMLRTVDTSRSGSTYDSLKVVQGRLAGNVAALDSAVDRLISVEIKRSSDSSRRKSGVREINRELRSLAGKWVECQRLSNPAATRLQTAKNRLAVLKGDSSLLLAGVLDASGRLDDPINQDSASGRIHRVKFRGSRYRVFISDNRRHLLQIHPNEKGAPVSLDEVWKQLERSREATPLMACNAGMYNENGSAVGLCISKKRLVRGLNTDTTRISDNFHLYPNGVFYVDSAAGYHVVITSRMSALLKSTGSVSHATQSGPMLLMDGAIHPAFMRNSPNLNIRNGIGVIESSRSQRCAIAISDDRVNFHDFALFFKYVLRCGNALYLDGAISQMVGVDGRTPAFARSIGLGPVLSVSTVKVPKKGK